MTSYRLQHSFVSLNDWMFTKTTHFLLIQTNRKWLVWDLLLKDALVILLCKLWKAHVKHVQHHDWWKWSGRSFHACKQITHRWQTQRLLSVTGHMDNATFWWQLDNTLVIYSEITCIISLHITVQKTESSHMCAASSLRMQYRRFEARLLQCAVEWCNGGDLWQTTSHLEQPGRNRRSAPGRTDATLASGEAVDNL